jgi:hypothetical protein
MAGTASGALGLRMTWPGLRGVLYGSVVANGDEFSASESQSRPAAFAKDVAPGARILSPLSFASGLRMTWLGLRGVRYGSQDDMARTAWCALRVSG